MDKLAAMEAFVAVVEAAGFAAAARRTGDTRAHLNKLVHQLEEHLATRLLQRTTRHVSPTEPGKAYYARCKHLLGELAELEADVADQHAKPRGPMRINAPMTFGTMHLGPLLAAFCARYPHVRVQLVLNDRFVDTIEEGFDMTLRISEPGDYAGLAMRDLAPIQGYLLAAPDHLARHGTPTDLDAAAAHPFLDYSHAGDPSAPTLTNGTLTRKLQVRPVFRANNGEVLRAMAEHGMGLAALPGFMVRQALEAGRLVRLLPDWWLPLGRLHALYPHHRGLSAKTRLLLQHLAANVPDLC